MVAKLHTIQFKFESMKKIANLSFYLITTNELNIEPSVLEIIDIISSHINRLANSCYTVTFIQQALHKQERQTALGLLFSEREMLHLIFNHSIWKKNV